MYHTQMRYLNTLRLYPLTYPITYSSVSLWSLRERLYYFRTNSVISFMLLTRPSQICPFLLFLIIPCIVFLPCIYANCQIRVECVGGVSSQNEQMLSMPKEHYIPRRDHFNHVSIQKHCSDKWHHDYICHK